MAKRSAENKFSKICDSTFDGMNIALYIVLEIIRWHECRAVKTRSDDALPGFGRQRGHLCGRDIVQSNENDWRRFAGGQGSLNPKGGVQLGLPSLVGDGNECQEAHRIFGPELRRKRGDYPGAAVTANQLGLGFDNRRDSFSFGVVRAGLNYKFGTF